MPADYLPVLLAFGVAIVAGVTLLGLSYWLGPKTGGRAKRTTYESGMPLLDRSHKRISVAFFLIAIDFIVFDIEAAFLYPWALVLRPCRHVHTVGMRFPIDVAFCDVQGLVLKTRTLAPWRLSPVVYRAAFTVEAEAGAFERWRLQPGDRLELRG